MRNLLTLAVATLFAISTGAALAASHAGAKMDDKDKKSDAKTADKKGDAKKTADTKK